MALRRELQPPALDEAKVERLAELVDKLDGGMNDPDAESWLSELNREAATTLTMRELQGIYGAMEAREWVAILLLRPMAETCPAPTREEAIEIVTLIPTLPPGPLEFYLHLLEVHLHPKVSDAIFWPKKADATPEEIVDELLRAASA